MRYCEDQGPRVKTAEGAFRLGLDSGGLKLRSLAGMERKADAYLKSPALTFLLLASSRGTLSTALPVTLRIIWQTLWRIIWQKLANYLAIFSYQPVKALSWQHQGHLE